MNDIKEILENKLNNSPDVDYEEGDFFKDGLLHCGICGTPKQTTVSLWGKTWHPRCLCKCQAEQRDRAQAEKERADAARIVDEMRKAAFPEEAIKNCRFDLDDLQNPTVSRVCRNYAMYFDKMKAQRKGLLLYGPVGTGKSFMGAAIANALIEKKIPCLVTNFSRLTNELFGLKEEKQKYLDNLNKFELLVIDDFAAERDTDYMLEQVYSIIDGRYRSGKPIIITTNLTGDALKNPSDQRKKRIYSRLLEMCIPIEVNGVDRRKVKLKESYKSITELLGLDED